MSGLEDREYAAKAERNILGHTTEWLQSDEGNTHVCFFCDFTGLKKSEVSVVFDEQDKTIYWIGPTSALPPNAKTHTTLTR